MVIATEPRKRGPESPPPHNPDSLASLLWEADPETPWSEILEEWRSREMGGR